MHAVRHPAPQAIALPPDVYGYDLTTQIPLINWAGTVHVKPGGVLVVVDTCPTCHGEGGHNENPTGWYWIDCHNCEIENKGGAGWVVSGYVTVHTVPIMDRPSGPEPGDPEMVYLFGSCWWHFTPHEHGDDCEAIVMTGDAVSGGVALLLIPVPLADGNLTELLRVGPCLGVDDYDVLTYFAPPYLASPPAPLPVPAIGAPINVTWTDNNPIGTVQ